LIAPVSRGKLANFKNYVSYLVHPTNKSSPQKNHHPEELEKNRLKKNEEAGILF